MSTSPADTAANPASEAANGLAAWSSRLGGIDWSTLALDWSLRLLGALLLLLVGLWVARKLSKALEKGLVRAKADPILISFLRNIAYFGGVIVVAIAALAQLGVAPASLLAVLGAAGLAIALAMRDSLSNFASGVMLILLHPFKAGDYVQVAGQEGEIQQVRIFQTRLRTIDHRIIVLPNSQITSAPIINFTALPRRRIDLTVGVGYEDDLAEARLALVTAAQRCPQVLADPAPDVLVVALAESSVNLLLRSWVTTPDYLQARSALLESIHTELKSRGLSIPHPQRDLHVYHHGDSKGTISMRDLVDDGGP